MNTAISALAEPAIPPPNHGCGGSEAPNWDTGLGLGLLGLPNTSGKFKKYHQFESEVHPEDVSVQINQVPVAMMSTQGQPTQGANACTACGSVRRDSQRPGRSWLPL